VPGFPLTIVTRVSCFHQAPATIPPTPSKVTILGQFVATPASQIAVVGCPFATATPQPCVTIRWTMMSVKVSVQAQPLLLMPPPDTGPAPGICIGPAPQGTAMMIVNQSKVILT
jgi:hypothetical protein